MRNLLCLLCALLIVVTGCSNSIPKPNVKLDSSQTITQFAQLIAADLKDCSAKFLVKWDGNYQIVDVEDGQATVDYHSSEGGAGCIDLMAVKIPTRASIDKQKSFLYKETVGNAIGMNYDIAQFRVIPDGHTWVIMGKKVPAALYDSAMLRLIDGLAYKAIPSEMQAQLYPDDPDGHRQWNGTDAGLDCALIEDVYHINSIGGLGGEQADLKPLVTQLGCHA